ncbi:hypothetical protein BGZ97_005829 [Linnemannia gamsii]|uniref:Uncharacterized protein n=1 Tax=Linnemannia gamsii TaxID=64522 RepID=A0A9P6QQE8_9FUNG|nr:hypothetical protein BGZ97_005829 [Linnemannia gamsii]
MASSNTPTATATAATTFPIFAQERRMRPSEQQILVDSGGIDSIQDNASPSYLDQSEKNVTTIMTTTTGSFADTQTEPVGKLPGKLKKTSQKSFGQQQSSMSTMVQTSIDKFTINSKKPSVSTRKVPETKFLVKTTPSSTTTNTNSRKLATETASIKPDPITTTIATTVPPKTTPTKSKPKLKTSHTSSPSPSSSASPKKTTPTASTPVKRRSLILTSTKPSPFSHARVKPTTYFELLPPPALSTVIHKPGDSPSPINNAAVKAGPGSGVSSTSFCSAPTGAAAKTPVKIKEPMPESKDVLTVKSNRPTPSNASSPVARNTAAITSTLIANDIMALPTKETPRRILNTNSDLKEFNSINTVTATANIRSEKSTAPTGSSITKSSTSIKLTVAPIEISRRVIKIKSSSPTTTTPTTAPKAAEASSGAASSEVKKTSSRSKKEPLTLIASQAQVNKRKSSSVPKPPTVAPVKPKSKPKPSNTSSNIVDPVSSTNTTATTTSVAILVSKTKTTSKGTTTCNSSNLSTTPKAPSHCHSFHNQDD